MKKKLPLDFVLQFSGEVRQGMGEDSWCRVFSETAGMIAVFDGCGGAGARKHDCYRGRSEAFMASRLAAGAVYESMMQLLGDNIDSEEIAVALINRESTRCLLDNRPERSAGAIMIRSKMIRTLPTTMAAALVKAAEGTMYNVSALWSGDSRVYLLTAEGLSQLTVDDSTQNDPMEGHFEDGVLTGLLTADEPVNLHCKTISIQSPFMVISATDGCFGYVHSPMEFEGLLLETLQAAGSPAQWEELIRERICAFAQDDHTLQLAAFGYGSFVALKNALLPRYQALDKYMLSVLRKTPTTDRELRVRMWNDYKHGYMKYIEEGTEL